MQDLGSLALDMEKQQMPAVTPSRSFPEKRLQTGEGPALAGAAEVLAKRQSDPDMDPASFWGGPNYSKQLMSSKLNI